MSEGAAEANGNPAANGAHGQPPGTDVTSVPFMPGRLSTAYDVQKPVGKGGYAVVYKGIRQDDGRVVAVKKVEIFEMTQKKRERCLQEVTLLQQLNHPYIIQMLDAFIDENMLIIVFEWAPAGDLKRLIKKTAEAGKTLDEASIWKFFSQITDALRYMHQHRIMHRDIKPANVLVGANGALKLGDLGLGRQLSEQTMEAFSKVGTPYYVSPEVVRGAGYDWKSDVWSLGCLLYELACLRSPFEMEGANLYDVFQKISKGDYQPLPADMFSAPLRSLVVRMLSVDPVKRPELEEVWSITQGVVQAQTNSRQDVHTVSEHLYTQLCVLETDVLHKLSKQNGKKVDLAVPPSDALRQLHPFFFAEPLVHPGSPAADEAQKRQLGTFMATFAWLMRLAGRSGEGAAIEGLLELVPAPSRKGGVVRGPQPPVITRTASGAARGGRSIKGGGGGASPPSSAGGAPSHGMLPSCTNMLRGAEAVKRAAQATGLSTEFAPINALATGHGRAVCAMMQDAVDLVLSQIQPSVRKPKYHEEGSGTGGGEGEGEEAQEEGLASGIGDGDDGDMITAAQPMPAAWMLGDENEEEAYFEDEFVRQRADASLARSASTSGRGGPAGRGAHALGSGPGRPGSQQAARQEPQQMIDPAAWRMELERLGPHLSRIKLPASGSGADMWGEWQARWEVMKKGLRDVSGESPAAATALNQLKDTLNKELDRIGTSERHLNNGVSSLLEQYQAARARLARAQKDVLAHEDLMQTGNAALQQLGAQLESVEQALQERAGTLDGGVAIKGMQDAIRRVKQDVRRMDLRIGVLQQQLASKQRKHLMAAFMAGAGDGWDAAAEEEG